MKTIQVQLGDRSYTIRIESGLLRHLPELLNEKNHGQKWLIISQQKLMDLFGNSLQLKLTEREFRCESITIPVGEVAKSLNEYRRVIGQMIELGCDRSTIILALGGGVVGDVAGFVAATFMRGVDYYQIPTTLLAMVDSAIGGKTGINIAAGKNLVGAIYQPQSVLVDPGLLTSLPAEETAAGLGEALKYGAIRDREFFTTLTGQLNDADHFDYESAIVRSCAIKAEVVSRDEREGDLRRILNFGHTIGHALEAYLGYGRLRHGEAVAYGMLCAGQISVKLGLLSKAEQSLLTKGIRKLPLPKLPQFDASLLMPYIKTDKKAVKGVLNFVVLDGLGNAVISKRVTEKMIIDSIKVIR